MSILLFVLSGNKGGGRTPLNWEIRSAITLVAARGIQYIQSHGQDISHRNIKSSNILLTKSLDARISNFGIANLVSLPPTPNRVAGYHGPEVTDPRRVSQKSDVYILPSLSMPLMAQPTQNTGGFGFGEIIVQQGLMIQADYDEASRKSLSLFEHGQQN